MSDFKVTEDQWRSIILNDAASDGKFFYAVKTTGIFCRPSCKSKPPNRENISVFPDAEHAMSAGYRPCKRCKPTGLRLPDEEWISVVAEYIDNHYMEELNLQLLADLAHGSPYHLHRTFKKVNGGTPVEYIQNVRIEQAKSRLLTTSQPVAEIGKQVGLANTPYFITLFKKITGLTPANYRTLYASVPKGEL
ncbi:bifunctional transcriptional activator/DNA repair enzyme AdaA [Fontibacillus sp. BL9]|uniref:bifunctional transcriptional activator/DNA repair enzyme AdaA n=1 Tax=Fontibacillus sp. BL9 TaxID=3389971 RepID=UPI003978DD7B